MTPEQEKEIIETVGLPTDFDFETIYDTYVLTPKQQEVLSKAIVSGITLDIVNTIEAIGSSVFPIIEEVPGGQSLTTIGNRTVLDNPRLMPILDDSNEPTYNEEGVYNTVNFKGHFQNDFVASLIFSLNTSTVDRMQRDAISSGLKTEEYFGEEIGGDKGVQTINFINEIFLYADSQINDWHENSTNFSNASTNIKKTIEDRTFSYDVNTYFGGLDYRDRANNTTPFEIILQKEIFGNAFTRMLDNASEAKKQSELLTDKKSEDMIRQQFGPKTKLQYEEFYDESYYATFGYYPSDEEKSETAIQMAEQYNPYLQSLVAKDKFERMNETMNTVSERISSSVSPVTERPIENYVTMEKINPDYEATLNVDSPENISDDKIKSRVTNVNSLREASNAKTKAQEDIMSFLVGG
jgi:hypothetical protein